jgi:hypothetical protein
VVKVGTPSQLTAPKSARVSISTSATPPAIIGRASGNAMRRKRVHGPSPSVRPTSSTQTD